VRFGTRKRDFLSFADLDRASLEGVLRRAEEFRLLRGLGTPHATRPGHVLGLIFEKASTRTRSSFEIASFDLGGHALVLGREGTQLGRGEPLRDTARVLSGYCHCLMIRTFGQERAQELAEYATVPVINGLTDLLHPCQLLADLQTVLAHFGVKAQKQPSVGESAAAQLDVTTFLQGYKYAWIGDGNNMANSWIEAAIAFDLDLALACPEGYEPDAQFVNEAAKQGRGRITVTRDPKAAVQGRHVISTDVFTSMGQEAETQQRLKMFAPYIVDEELMKCADPEAIVLHCLPAHRGEEISEAVLEGPQSQVWLQAENRLHAQKALVEMLLA